MIRCVCSGRSARSVRTASAPRHCAIASQGEKTGKIPCIRTPRIPSSSACARSSLAAVAAASSSTVPARIFSTSSSRASWSSYWWPTTGLPGSRVARRSTMRIPEPSPVKTFGTSTTGSTTMSARMWRHA